MTDAANSHIPEVSRKDFILSKRIILLSATLVETLAHVVLTSVRYEGQGLSPQFFRFSTRSDIFSNLLFLFNLFLIARAIWNPLKMSFARTVIVLIAGFIIFWITLGARNFEAGEFPHAASTGYLFIRAAYIALLLPRKEYNFSRIAGAWKVLKNSLLAFLTAIIFTFIFSFTYQTVSDSDELRRFDADAAIVLGAAVWHGSTLGERPSPTLMERLKIGEELVRQNIVPKIVTTGASDSPNERPEAEIARKALLGDGIDNSKIITEENSHSTLGQILYIRNELDQRQGWKKFIIVSDQYHLARALEMCKFNRIDAIGSPSVISQPFFDLAYYRFRESLALLSYWILGK